MPADFSRVIRSVLIRSLTPNEAEQLAHATIRASAAAGTIVMREGEKVDGFFLLLTGIVDILKARSDGGEQVINTVQGPTMLGEMSLLGDLPHSATVRAQTDCELYVLTRPQFTRLLQGDSIAAYKLVVSIAEVLARRLYRMDEKLLEVSGRPDCPPPVEEIADFKKKLFSRWSF
jgi:CRP-like cAMP-binding protein